ncbi:winged-helix domain-containing protein [Halobacterium litoreum]
MQATDDRILEFLESEGRSTPSSMTDEGPYDYHRKTVQRRLSKLMDAGLVERVGRGLYQITNEGQRYLAGQADLRDTPEPE